MHLSTGVLISILVLFFSITGALLAALERIMADDVTYIHASGKTDTRKLIWMPFAPVNSTTFPGSQRICKCAWREVLR
jgi:hypothetical protein